MSVCDNVQIAHYVRTSVKFYCIRIKSNHLLPTQYFEIITIDHKHKDVGKFSR